MKSLFDKYYAHYSKMYAYFGERYLDVVIQRSELLEDKETLKAVKAVKRDINKINESQKV
ncbi:hypothetical protein GO491_11850 [Flavobacteriaceae bacterium Ap0902]|nr:hypothetical protein [Flavobacteriaceae bacterium Ap0902]